MLRHAVGFPCDGWWSLCKNGMGLEWTEEDGGFGDWFCCAWCLSFGKSEIIDSLMGSGCCCLKNGEPLLTNIICALIKLMLLCHQIFLYIIHKKYSKIIMFSSFTFVFRIYQQLLSYKRYFLGLYSEPTTSFDISDA